MIELESPYQLARAARLVLLINGSGYLLRFVGLGAGFLGRLFLRPMSSAWNADGHSAFTGHAEHAGLRAEHVRRP